MKSILDKLNRLAETTRGKHSQLNKYLFGLSIVIFGLGIVLSWRADPNLLDRIAIEPLVVLLVLTTPAGLTLNALDFQATGRICGVTVSFWRAIRVAIYSRAANQLPIPGNFAVKIAALKTAGTTIRKSGGVSLFLTLIYGGVGFCYSSFWLLLHGSHGIAFLFALIGLCILGVAASISVRASLSLPWIAATAVYRLGLVAIDALSLLIALSAIGIEAGYEQTAILVVAGFLTSFAPVGIGIRETLIAFLAPLAGIDPAAGFLAAAVARIVALAFLAMCAVIGIIDSRASSKSRD